MKKMVQVLNQIKDDNNIALTLHFFAKLKRGSYTDAIFNINDFKEKSPGNPFLW